MKDFIIGWKGDGAPVYFCDFEADPGTIKTLHRLSPSGAVAVLAINRVSPEFFDGSPIKRARIEQRHEIHQAGRTLQ